MAVQNTLTQEKQKTGMTAYLTQEAVKNQINKIVGEKNGTRFIASIVSAVQTNAALRNCSNQSILAAALLGESLNLSPSPQLGQFYLIPFKNNQKGIVEAQFQLGYKGYIQLAIRSGYYKKLIVSTIKEGELIRYNQLEEEIEVNLIEDEVKRENTPTIGYYTMFEYANGFRKSIYWSKQKMLAHADKYSKAFDKKILERIQAGEIPDRDMWKYSSFWYRDFDGMALKTMLRQLISKWGIMSIELQTAIEKDMGVLKEDGTVEYIENEVEENTVADSIYSEKEKETQPKKENKEHLSNSFFENE